MNDTSRMAFTTEATSTLETAERNDVVRVENNVLIIDCEEFHADGASQYTTIEVAADNTVRIALLVAPAYPSTRPARHAVGEAVHAALAAHIRGLAMPLIAEPKSGMEEGVNRMIAAALQTLALKPLVELVH